jgi:hypothetical protein
MAEAGIEEVVLTMLYELRIYHCMPGKLPAVVARFENATVALFEKHGIQQVGFWTVNIGESSSDLYYILKWDSLDERQKKFAAFAADPDWIAVRAKSEEGGPILESFSNSILTPTRFSALK